MAFEAGRIMLHRLRTLVQPKSTLRLKPRCPAAPLPRFCQLRVQGYQVHIYYVALPSAALATQRVALRVKLGGQ